MNSIAISALDNILNRLDLTKDDLAVLSWAGDATKNGAWATLSEDCVEKLLGRHLIAGKGCALMITPVGDAILEALGAVALQETSGELLQFPVRQATSAVRGPARVLQFPAQQTESKMIH